VSFKRHGGNPDKNNQPIADKAISMGATVAITTSVGFDFPDQVWGFEGLTILVEVTNPDVKPSKKTKERKARQALFRSKWRGGLAVEIRTEADVVALLTSIHATAAGQVARIVRGTAPAPQPVQPLQDRPAAAEHVTAAEHAPGTSNDGALSKLRQAEGVQTWPRSS
jgi:hypothetical protein